MSSCIFISWISLAFLLLAILPCAENGVPVPVENSRDSELMLEVSKILCRARIKVLFVYFENRPTHDHSGEILRLVTKCDISYISLRSVKQRYNYRYPTLDG